MSDAEPSRLVRINISEGDRFGSQPLYEAIVRTCQESGVAGATVFRGVEGYGSTAGIHRKHLLTADQPLAVIVVDSEENIARVLPALEQMVDTGLIVVSSVEVRRVRNGTA
jgi:PII-like signaling protein